MYKATVKVMGKTYNATGDSIMDVLVGLKPKNCKGKVILTIENGKRKKERILMPAIAFRLFNSSAFTREVALKNTAILFQGI